MDQMVEEYRRGIQNKRSGSCPTAVLKVIFSNTVRPSQPSAGVLRVKLKHSPNLLAS